MVLAVWPVFYNIGEIKVSNNSLNISERRRVDFEHNQF